MGVEKARKNGVFGLLTIYRLIIKKGFEEDQSEFRFKLALVFPLINIISSSNLGKTRGN